VLLVQPREGRLLGVVAAGNAVEEFLVLAAEIGLRAPFHQRLEVCRNAFQSHVRFHGKNHNVTKTVVNWYSVRVGEECSAEVAGVPERADGPEHDGRSGLWGGCGALGDGHSRHLNHLPYGSRKSGGK